MKLTSTRLEQLRRAAADAWQAAEAAEAATDNAWRVHRDAQAAVEAEEIALDEVARIARVERFGPRAAQ